MHNVELIAVYGIGVLILLVALYLLWPYIVGGLAIVGGVQVYRFWRQHGGKL